MITGCRIPVVHTLRVRVDWVRFPAPRPVIIKMGIAGRERLAIEQAGAQRPGLESERKGFPAPRPVPRLNLIYFYK